MPNVLKLSSSILTGVLKKNLEFTRVFKMGDIVNFAINHNPTRVFRVVMENLVQFLKNLNFSLLLSSLSLRHIRKINN